MHWLSERVETLRQRHDAWQSVRSARVAGAPSDDRAARGAFFSEVRELVEAIARHPGVDAAFAAHDGLLVEGVGSERELEAAAAALQKLRLPGEEALDVLGAGSLNQLLVVGSERKLVVLTVGEIALGLVAPVGVHLGDRLSTET